MKVSGKFNTPATSPLEKETPVPTEKQAGWAVHQVWILVKGEKFYALPRSQTTIPQASSS